MAAGGKATSAPPGTGLQDGGELGMKHITDEPAGSRAASRGPWGVQEGVWTRRGRGVVQPEVEVP